MCWCEVYSLRSYTNWLIQCRWRTKSTWRAGPGWSRYFWKISKCLIWLYLSSSPLVSCCHTLMIQPVPSSCSSLYMSYSEQCLLIRALLHWGDAFSVCRTNSCGLFGQNMRGQSCDKKLHFYFGNGTGAQEVASDFLSPCGHSYTIGNRVRLGEKH